ncbi:MAG TPA: YdcF family protein, partial [Massilia sp.]|nr:YdcF family protein [Massilia sp.]
MSLQPVLDLINLVPRDLILPPANLFLVIFAGLLLWRRWPRLGRVVAGSGLAALFLLA